MTYLDGPRFGPLAGGPARQLVVLLHGYGADGNDLIGLAPELGRALPHAAFASPHAPEPCEQSPFGRQWFGLADRAPAAMAEGVRRAAPTLAAFLRAELGRLALPASALSLLGFSQGAMLALFAGLREDPAPASILAFSGALLAADTLAAELRQRPQVLLVHGEADPVVPAAASRAGEAVLRAAAVPVEALYRPGLEHGIDGAGLAAAASLLGRIAPDS